jgi:hypothetical protein
MKTIQRWLKNLKWLFNHPPVGTTECQTNVPCEFCGCPTRGERYWDEGECVFSMCHDCYFKAFRKVLAPKKKGAK